MTEADYEYLDRLYEQIDELQSQVASLNRALDKACEVMTNRVNIDSGDGTPTLHFTKEQWKEWCMKDE